MCGAAYPVHGLADFLARTAEIERGDVRPFPTYCALLYTTEKGTDEAIARYVSESFGELHAMTGNDCLVFLVGR